MIRIAVSGGRGRMGERICRIIDKNPDTELALIIERSGHPEAPGEYLGVEVTSDISSAALADVVIDFSAPDSTMGIIEECLKTGTGLVIGTTGFSESQVGKITEAAARIPVLLSPNMSIGVNLIFKLARMISESLPGFEKEIVEAHHNKKADAPSGTALKIAELIAAGDDTLVNGRSGGTGPRKPGEIGLHAVRGGNIVGEHTVMWIGEYERIELFHRAETRDIFASGAVRAAVWLSSRTPGRLYGMSDVLS